MKILTLDCLSLGESGILKELCVTGSMQRRMIDLGFVEGTRIKCVGRSPAGDPCAYLVRGAVIAIRLADAQRVFVCEEAEDGTY